MNELFIRRKFINLYPTITWLTQETNDAIVAVFGVEDGQAVIVATSDYLDQVMKDSGKERAIALARFINEDPMLVMSLIEGLGTRWLQGDGQAYINSGYVVKATDRILIKGYMPVGGPQSTFFGWRWQGSFTDDYQCYLIFNNSPGLMMVGSTSKIGSNKNIPYGVDFEAIVDFKNHIRQYKYGGTTVDDSSTADFVSPISQNTPAYVMGFNILGTSYGYPTTGKIYDADLTGWHGVPCKHNNVAGMLDIVNAQWYPNANSSGSFTIEYSLQDGETPWTPANS